jgi:hypothetical protein
MKSMGLLMALALTFGVLESQAFLSCKKGDAETLQLATDHYTKIAKAHADGIIRKSDVHRANIFLYEAKLCTETITTKEFCEAVSPTVRELNSFQEFEYGTGTAEERRDRIALFAETKALCD